MVSFQPGLTFTECLGFRIRSPGGLGARDALSSRGLVCGYYTVDRSNVTPQVMTADPVRANSQIPLCENITEMIPINDETTHIV